LLWKDDRHRSIYRETSPRRYHDKTASPISTGFLTLLLLIVPDRWSGAWAQEKGQTANAGQAPAGGPFKENDKIPEKLRQDTFLFVWEKIRDDYFDPNFGGVDWGKIKGRYGPLVAGARTSSAFHALLRKMLGELSGSHLVVLAPHELTREKKAGEETRMAPEGLDFRFVEGRVTVFRVKPDSPPWAAGLRPGNVVLRVGELSPALSEESSASRLRSLTEVRRTLAGESSTSVIMTVVDENNRERKLELPRTVTFQDRAHLARAKLEYGHPSARVGYIWFDG
jgi:C-terminal processing protease CtpA/Prc